MVLVLILLAIIVFIILFMCLVICSTLKIQLIDFNISNIHQIENRYAIKISLYAFNKIKWIGVTLTKQKLKRLIKKVKLSKFEINKIEQDLRIEDLNNTIKKIELKISYFNLKAILGTEDAIITSFAVCFISSLISIILPHLAKSTKKKNYYYCIKPLYSNKNKYEIKFNCIIEVKVVHIINVIYIFIKKGSRNKYERTSNRRAYGYSYE